MLKNILSSTTAIALAFGTISTASIATLAFTADAAFAGNGNGNNGNGNGNGGSRNNGNNGNGNGNGKNNHGAIASALGALNAAHANENALLNASPNSRVGMIAAYRDAAVITNELSAVAALLAGELALLTPPPRLIADIEADIQAAIDEGLDTGILDQELADALAYDSTDYDAALLAFNEADLAASEQQLIENDLLEAAANKDVPEGEALLALRDMLGL